MNEQAGLAVPDADVRSLNLIYYVDVKGKVTWANRPFAWFAEVNGAPRLASAVIGTSILDNFSGVHRARWSAIYPQLFEGRLSGHAERFSCPSPIQRREYVLRIVPVEIDGDLYLRHETGLLTDGDGELELGEPLRRESLHRGKGFEVAVCLRPLEPESGDGVWSRDLGDGKAFVVIADAMGHGPQAAAALAEFFALLDGDSMDDAKAALVRTNDRFMARPGQTPGDTMFITGLLMIVDSTHCKLEMLCFGHHGVVFTPSGPIEVPGGVPVGLISDYDAWPVVSMDLEKLGTRVLAYTDGIVEQFDPGGSMYGVEALTRDFSVTSSLPLAKSLSAVLRNVDRWRGNALVKDDQTLLGIDIHCS